MLIFATSYKSLGHVIKVEQNVEQLAGNWFWLLLLPAVGNSLPGSYKGLPSPLFTQSLSSSVTVTGRGEYNSFSLLRIDILYWVSGVFSKFWHIFWLLYHILAHFLDFWKHISAHFGTFSAHFQAKFSTFCEENLAHFKNPKHYIHPCTQIWPEHLNFLDCWYSKRPVKLSKIQPSACS